MPRQLTIEGKEVAHPVRFTRLTVAQREILLHARAYGQIRPIEAGIILHRCRRHPCWYCPDSACCWASSDGAAALKRLAKRNLVYREKRGDWRPVRVP